MRVIPWMGIAGFAVVASAAACSSEDDAKVVEDADAAAVEGADAETSNAADGGATLPFPLGQVCEPSDLTGDECGKCGREKCCETRDAVIGDDAGMELVACTQAPGCDATEACMSDCFAKYPAQVDAYLAHLSCLGHRCTDACDAPVNRCAKCLETNCLRESLACELSKDCFLIDACGAECESSDTACIKACLARYPEGEGLENAVLVCSSNRCPSECLEPDAGQ